MSAEHTPPPWFVGSYSSAIGQQIVAGSDINGAPNVVVATVHHASHNPKEKITAETRANAKLIVRACNEHEARVAYTEACELFVQFLGTLPKGWLGKTTGDIGLLNEAYLAQSRARAALAKAQRGEQ
jgi:hypothetical protein